MLPKRRTALRHQTNKLVEKVSTMDAALARPLRNRRVEPLPCLPSIWAADIHPPPEVKPRVLLLSEIILCPSALISALDTRANEPHGAHGVGAKRDTRADLGEGRSRFINMHAQARMPEEADRKREAANTPAADGD